VSITPAFSFLQEIQVAGSYGPDVAYIHDQGFSEYSLDASRGVLRLLRESSAAPGLIVELGCGSGILARQLGFHGYNVLGVDHSRSMLRIAKKRAPAAELVHASLVTLTLPRCSAVLAIGEVLSFAFAAEPLSRLNQMFVRIYKALQPGGIFLLDFGKPGRYPGGMPRQGFWTGKDWAILLEVDAAEGDLLTRHFTSFRRVGELYRKRVETHTLRLFETDDISLRLQRAGFLVKPLKALGSLRFQSGHGGVLACKPGSSR